MKISPKILSCIREIREYSEKYPELSTKAHHFLFDKRYSDSDTIDYIVMGINPGETVARTRSLLEETSEHDFSKNERPTRSANMWRTKCIQACGTEKIALTEAFFWSSSNVSKLMKNWGKDVFTQSAHAVFCAGLNKILIETHNPKAIVFVGIGYANDVARLYELTQSAEIQKNEKGRKLIVTYRDSSARPWIFVKHFSAWMSRPEMEQIAQFVAQATASKLDQFCCH